MVSLPSPPVTVCVALVAATPRVMCPASATVNQCSFGNRVGGVNVVITSTTVNCVVFCRCNVNSVVTFVAIDVESIGSGSSINIIITTTAIDSGIFCRSGSDLDCVIIRVTVNKGSADITSYGDFVLICISSDQGVGCLCNSESISLSSTVD